MKTTLRNSFHKTEYTTTKTREELDAIADDAARGTLSQRDARFLSTVRNRLCGVNGCTCGTNEFNER